MRIVVDASVILAAYEPGEDGRQAMEFRDRAVAHELVAPPLIAWEIGNRFTRMPIELGKSGGVKASEAALALLDGLQLETMTREHFARTMELAVKHRLTFYDASYLEAAVRFADSLLVTQDPQLLDAAKNELGPERVADLKGAIDRLP